MVRTCITNSRNATCAETQSLKLPSSAAVLFIPYEFMSGGGRRRGKYINRCRRRESNELGTNLIIWYGVIRDTKLGRKPIIRKSKRNSIYLKYIKEEKYSCKRWEAPARNRVKTGAHREKWSRHIFKLLARRQSKFC